jgi:hypothetical protein
MTIMYKNKKPAPITIIPKALPHIEREVMITCNANITDAKFYVKWVTYILQRFNHIIRQSADITLLPFILTQITNNTRLVLTTNPTTPATAYASYLPMLSAEINALHPMDPHINRHWTKFLVHNIPTNAKLPDVKAEIETTYPSLHLATEPPLACPQRMPYQQILLYPHYLPNWYDGPKASWDNITCYLQPHVSHQHFVMDERGTEAESRELAAGVDGSLGVGAGLEGMAMRWRGKARWKT